MAVVPKCPLFGELTVSDNYYIYNVACMYMYMYMYVRAITLIHYHQ